MSALHSQAIPSLPVKSSTWFVTGINRGLGRSIAEAILERGGRVAGTVRRRIDAAELKERFPSQLWVSELDVSDLANIPKVFEEAVKALVRIHAVVSNAGYSLLGAAEELELDAMRHIVDTNLLGSIQLARAAVAHMRPLRGGRIIQISSGAGQSSFPGLSLYCATKWGIEGFFEALSQEVAGFGIGTTLVEPGVIFYMVDLDCLKEVNDRYGHLAGDNVLKEVTKRIAAIIRSSDVLVRWGGDEFLIVSRYADRREAEVFALRILMAVGPSDIAVQDGGVAVRQTCSIGWAAFPWNTDNPAAISVEAVLSLADRGAYEAKTTGRNRAIGVLPAENSALFFVAAAGDHSVKYPVQTTSVDGPTQTKARTCNPLESITA